MILIKKFENVYFNQLVLLDFLKENGSLDYDKLLSNENQIIEVRFIGENNEDTLNQFQYDLKINLDKYLTANRLFSTSNADKKKKVRSKIGLFFDQRKDSIIKDKILFEYEIPTGHDLTYFVGSIMTNSLLTEDVVDRLPNHFYKFTYGTYLNSEVDSNKLSESQLSNIFCVQNEQVKLRRHSIISSLITDQSYLYWSEFNGADEGMVTIYLGKDVSGIINDAIASSLSEEVELIKENISQNGYSCLVDSFLRNDSSFMYKKNKSA